MPAAMTSSLGAQGPAGPQGPQGSGAWGTGTPGFGPGIVGSPQAGFTQGGVPLAPPQGPQGAAGPVAPNTQPAPTPAAPAPVPAAPSTAQDFMSLPGVQAYVQQFAASQGAQQQAINASLLQAMQGLGARRDAAAKVVATAPQEATQAYHNALAAQTAAGKTAAHAAGGPTIGGSAMDATLAHASAIANAGAQKGQPLLEAANTANYTQGQNALNNTQLQNEGALQQQQAQFDQSMALAKMGYDAQAAAAQQGENYNILNSKLGTQNAIDQYAQTYGKTAQTPAQTNAAALALYQQEQGSAPAQGPAGQAGFTTAEAAKISASPEYQAAMQLMGTSTGTKPGSPGYYGPTQPGQTWGNFLSTTYANQPQMLAFLLANLGPGLVSSAPIPANGSAVPSFGNVPGGGGSQPASPLLSQVSSSLLRQAPGVASVFA